MSDHNPGLPRNQRRAAFLDRDGTIARDVPYCSRPEDLELLPGAGEAIRLLNEAGLLVVVITNQSGIARGFFDEETLSRIHAEMERQLAACGAHVDTIYYCPHHPDDRCQCRKPQPTLILQAAQEWGIDVESSYVVGDSQADIEMGHSVGCRTALIAAGPAAASPRSPERVVRSLLEAAQWIRTHQAPTSPTHQ